MEALATSTADPKAIAAMRERHPERFTELETERTQIKTELATLTTQHARLISPELLDALPVIPAILAELPAKLRRRLYQAFDISIVYKHDTSQATYRATITTSTPATVAAIIHDTGARSSDSACVPTGQRHEGQVGARGPRSGPRRPRHRVAGPSRLGSLGRRVQHLLAAAVQPPRTALPAHTAHPAPLLTLGCVRTTCACSCSRSPETRS
jgi:hypothetical protein